MLDKLELQVHNTPLSATCEPIECTQIDWSALPKDLDPYTAHVSAPKAARKRAQVANLATLVAAILARRSIAPKPDARCSTAPDAGPPADPPTVIEFGSGGGHLGLVLASLHPAAHFILLEVDANAHAICCQRICELGLQNAEAVLGDATDFTGRFDIAVGLHCCGSLTDAVIAQCRRVHAGFVLCPCCYGHAAPPLLQPGVGAPESSPEDPPSGGGRQPRAAGLDASASPDPHIDPRLGPDSLAGPTTNTSATRDPDLHDPDLRGPSERDPEPAAAPAPACEPSAPTDRDPAGAIQTICAHHRKELLAAADFSSMAYRDADHNIQYDLEHPSYRLAARCMQAINVCRLLPLADTYHCSRHMFMPPTASPKNLCITAYPKRWG